MKIASLLLVFAAGFMSGCSFDASSRPSPPAPPTAVSPPPSASYCCQSCEVTLDQTYCDRCQRTERDSCAGDNSLLVCKTSRVEEPDSGTTFRVSCL